MGIRQFKPVTPATRFRSVADCAEITRTEPERSLAEREGIPPAARAFAEDGGRLVLSALDLFVILLTWLEYRRLLASHAFAA